MSECASRPQDGKKISRGNSFSSAKRTAEGTPTPRQPSKKHSSQRNLSLGATANKRGPRGKTGKRVGVSLNLWASSGPSNIRSTQSYVASSTSPRTARPGIYHQEVSRSSQPVSHSFHSPTWMSPTAASIARRVQQQHVYSPRIR